jgi:D-sedoheptulose 7-phosphate isomerase
MSKIKKFSTKYMDNIYKAIHDTDFKNLDISTKEILKTIKRNGSIYVCGNGGSAAIANHYVVDFLKFFRENTTLKPKIFSLSSNIETITAISNDIDYKRVFSYQAENLL